MKIYEPGRVAYRNNKNTEGICQFCDENVIEKQRCLSLECEYWMVIANKYPYADGNIMVIPKRHVRDIGDLSKDEWLEFHEVLSKTIGRLGEIFDTKDFNVGVNIGMDAGGSIEHLHWQVIPRKKKISNATNIFADIQVITVLPEDLVKIIDGK